VTLSVGVAATEGGAASFDDLVQEVTGHLASARWGGGNQVVRGQDFTTDDEPDATVGGESVGEPTQHACPASASTSDAGEPLRDDAE
jgi:hypothetical protein